VNILLIHQHFNTPETGGPVRSWYLATALARKGHQVVVITASAGPYRKEVAIDGIRVIYLPISYNNRFSFNARAWAFARFAWSASRAASRFRQFDICYAISVPLTVGLCAMYLKWRYRIPYWFEVGDLWPDAPIELGYIRNPILKWATLFLERSIYRNAIGVVALSVPIMEAIKRKVPGLRLALVPNMADCDFYTPEQEPGNPGEFTISYSGALGAANGLGYLLDCAASCLRSRLPVKFVICGDGAMLDILKKRAEFNQLTNVSFAGFLNRDGVRDVLRRSQAVIVSYHPSPILETGCPNKYFDGLAAGKIIIVNFGGWVREEIESGRCGFYVDPRSPEHLVQKVKEVLASPEKQAGMQREARRIAEEKYTRRALSETFVRLFEEPG